MSSPARPGKPGDVQRRQRRRVRDRHGRRARGHEARRLGTGRPRQGQDGDEQADHDDHQHPYARRPHRKQRPLRCDRRHRRAREHRRRTWRRWTPSRATMRSSCRKKTFKDKMSLGSGKDRIDLYYFGAGHTSGDCVRRVSGAPGACMPATCSPGRTRRCATGTTAAAAWRFPQTLRRRWPASRTSTRSFPATAR